LVTVLAAVTIAFAGLIGGFNVVLSNRLSHDGDEVLRARAAAQISGLTTEDGRLVTHEAPDERALESDTWVFAGGRLLERPRTNAEINRSAVALVRGPQRFFEVPGQHTRLYAVPIVSHGKRLGTVVAGISLLSYEHTQHDALIASVILIGLLLVVVALVARWVIALALRPVAQMTTQATDWSEHDLDRRFGLGEPHDELTTLAATLDNLLSRVAASLRHEQRFTSEISHELRTPLTKVRAEAELALRHERSADSYRKALQRVLEGADQMGRIIDTLLVAAREEASSRRGTADVQEAALRAIESCYEFAASRGVEIDFSPEGPPARVAGDSDLVERILVPLIENACRYGRSRVIVTSESRNGAVTYTVGDDGPGVKQEESDRIFEPGVRGSTGRDGGDGDGAGLGLALARRLARAARGDVEAHAGEHGGRFTIVLPSV
jgi:signal transduction histidine kinase